MNKKFKPVKILFYISIITILTYYTSDKILRNIKISHTNPPTTRISIYAQSIVNDMRHFYEKYNYYPIYEPSEKGGVSYNTISLLKDENLTNHFKWLTYEIPAAYYKTIDYWDTPYNIGIRGVTMSTNLFNILFGEDEEDVVVWSSGVNKINEYGQGDDILNANSKKEQLRTKEFYRKHGEIKYSF